MIDASILVDLPPDQQTAVMDRLGELDPLALVNLVADATRAVALRDSGDLDGARAIIGQYREMADAAGLGAVFDGLVESL